MVRQPIDPDRDAKLAWQRVAKWQGIVKWSISLEELALRRRARPSVKASPYLLPTAEHADHQFDDQQWKQIISDFLDENLRGAGRSFAAARCGRTKGAGI